ncbi:type 4 pilus major pilin [Serratia quinivorans]|uniref:type 4 pilus major pilin n=1 Tax=Serratia quinivorans TaxID=137545 RepID=UPI002178714B|nr:type 4 pilus major pilin [Serratia quinivorans]CAI1007202.1 PilS N terminal [Serratia quinivorans]CAI1807840.1 PilS N terminal [Serratia quinivorans]
MNVTAVFPQKKQVEHHRQQGFTALELIIVLVVGFSIIALSASKISALFSSSANAEAASNILSISTEMMALKSSNGYGADGDDMVPLLIQMKSIPKNMSITGDKLFNQWGKEITIPVINSGAGYSINYQGVPAENCTKIGQQLLKTGIYSSMEIGSEKIKTDAKIAEISKACGTTAQAMTFNVGE